MALTPVAPRPRGLLRSLVSESAIYGLGGIAAQAVYVILVPIYADVLGPSGTGIAATVTTTLSLSLMLVSLSLPQAFLRWYLKVSETDRQRANVLHTTLALRLLASVAGSLVIAALIVPLTLLLYGDFSYTGVYLVIPAILLFDSILSMPLTFLRAQRRPRAYAALSFGRAFLGSLIIVVLVLSGAGVMGVVIGSAVGAAVAAAAGLWILQRDRLLTLRWDGDLVRKMLGFGLPLVPAALAGWTLNLSDRYLLQGFTDAATVGVYSLGYTAGLLVSALAVQPFSIAWGAAYWDLAKREDAAAAFARVLVAFTAAGSLIALTLSALGTDAIRLVLTDDFEPARFVVPFSAFSYVLYGVFTILTAGLNLENQTRWLPITMGAAAVAGVALNLVLIPLWGFMGAAVSTLVSYVLLASLSGAASQRYYPVPWDLPRLFVTLGLGGGLAAAALLGPDLALWRIGCIIAFPIAMVLLRVVRVADLVAVIPRR